MTITGFWSRNRSGFRIVSAPSSRRSPSRVIPAPVNCWAQSSISKKRKVPSTKRLPSLFWIPQKWRQVLFRIWYLCWNLTYLALLHLRAGCPFSGAAVAYSAPSAIVTKLAAPQSTRFKFNHQPLDLPLLRRFRVRASWFSFIPQIQHKNLSGD